jgi:EAL domain-containing protein (putative c-di-GMP-specific phosphodiesterase class I)
MRPNGTVAEGVESEQQMNWLLAHGCHLGQGYYFSPPVSSANIHEVIRGIETRLAVGASGLH